MNPDYYISLIYKQLTESISDSEKKELATWRRASKENEIEAKSVELAWNASIRQKAKPVVDLDAEFAFLEDRILEDEKEKEGGKVVQIPRAETKKNNSWLRIAAGVAILVLAGFLFRSFFSGNEEIQWVEIRTTEEVKTIILTDNSTIHLNKNSYLKYPKELLGKTRTLELEGEAFFEVTRNENQPFIVETSGEKITVLGTSFNVKSFKKSNEASVYVASGKVEFKEKKNNNSVILNKGKGAVFQRENDKFSMQEKLPSNAFTWHNKKLVFDDINFEKAVNQITQYYGIGFDLSTSQVSDCLLNTSFDVANAGQFLEDIKTIFGVKIEDLGNKKYAIKGGSCE